MSTSPTLIREVKKNKKKKKKKRHMCLEGIFSYYYLVVARNRIDLCTKWRKVSIVSKDKTWD